MATIEEEYRNLIRETYTKCKYDKFCSALHQLNKSKNRYNDVLPKEDTRVKLSIDPDNPGSDYINANFVYDDITNSNKKYICSQAPLPSTFNDFWKMIWEQNVTSIVTLIKLKENGKVKGERYWPNKLGVPSPYGKFQVELIKTITTEDEITINVFHMKHGDSIRKVVQFYFQGWPDFGVPLTTEPVRKLSHLLKEYHKDRTCNTILVHCSAGIGRTGTFLAIDLSLSMLNKDILANRSSPESSTLEYDGDDLNEADYSMEIEDSVSSSCSSSDECKDELKNLKELIPDHAPPIKEIVLCLRRQRNHGMVQTEEQYKFIYRSIIDEITIGTPQIPQSVLKMLME